MKKDTRISENKFKQLLGISLRRQRKKLRLTQDQVAKHAGITRNYLSLIENGKRTGTIWTIHSIATAVGIELSAIITSAKEAVQIPVSQIRERLKNI
ncbi:MAG: helix-turn-helix transcriptional regulator [Candidatus Buchananbacteria bacterium]|nr:helix-turn-helix transcriptional regulator [Candidatus Buchananbacteria bacterium]